MAKKISGQLKLQIPAGSANPSPPVGPALGQRGVNIMEFCKAFNDATKEMQKGLPVPVEITVYQDKTFSFLVKTVPASYQLMQASKIKKGSQTPGRDVAGRVSMKQCREIAENKMKDLNANDLDQAAKIIAGTARSIGLEVIGG